MSETVHSLSQKRYNEMKRLVIIDAIDIVLNTIATQASVEAKDKSFTVKKLTKSVDLLYKKLSEINNNKIPSDIINTLKPKILPKLNNTFCYKSPTKNEKNEKENNITSENQVFFTLNIQQAIEIPFKEIKKEFKLQKSIEHYRFFVFPLIKNENEYIITYAEENKYSKREIVEILHNNVSVDKNILSDEIKNKYGFI